MSEFYTKLSKDEVKKILIDLMVANGMSEDDAEEFDGDAMDEYIGTKANETSNGYSISGEEQQGGEGQGDEYWFVWKIAKGDVNIFVKVEGHYDSWNGASWDSCDFSIVEPYEVTVTKWKKVK